MKKKIVLLAFFMCVVLTGCTPLQEMSLDDIIDNGTNRQVSVYNKYRKGYKYNLPKGLGVLDSTEYNEVIASSDYTYYLYVDAVSYYNKIIETYEENDVSFYSKAISFEDKYGYLEINEIDNGKYFIEIMYNYAKIEVIVDENALSESIAYAMTLLSSIQYQDTVLKSLMGEDVLSSNEVEHNIFETAQTESGYLEIVEEYGTYEEEEEPVDPDFIRR